MSTNRSALTEQEASQASSNGDGGSGKQITYRWEGGKILTDTHIENKRHILTPGGQPVPVTMDVRDWITLGERCEIKHTIDEMKKDKLLPIDRDPTSFDERALACLKYVNKHIRYVPDRWQSDLWQLPAETLALKSGDCEDHAFLLGSLLLASGISQYCVRVVLGRLIQNGSNNLHALVCYLDESGRWQALDSTCASTDNTVGFIPADELASAYRNLRFIPNVGINYDHVWSIAPEVSQWGTEIYQQMFFAAFVFSAVGADDGQGRMG